MLFLRIFQHLLPNARAWRITVDKKLRQFFEGLAPLGSDIRDFFDGIFGDIFPATTRELDYWEDQFGLPRTLTVEQERRDRLDGAWKALGGQSPRYIQDTLQNAGFDVYVHEWWQLPEQPTPDPQVPRIPKLILEDGAGPISGMQTGAITAQTGSQQAQTGGILVREGYPLVNNDDVVTVPNDASKWPYFLYIAGENFVDTPSGLPIVDVATIPATRRSEFEALCLKICPCQQWLGLIVEYV